MSNPSIEELQNNDEYELIVELHHSQIKEFVISRFTENNLLIKIFMYYQVIMVLLGIFILTRGIVLSYRGISEPLFYSLGALAFSFTILVPIHELLHGISIKLTGAKKVHYGAYLRKFIFYAEADRHVMNRKQFALVALTPLIIIKVVTLVGIIVFWHSVWIYFFGMVMAVHSLFCAGDIGLLSVFYADGYADRFTFDIKAERKSYYYQRKNT
ncbi:MAG TPA: DUF3267 domain-containing protein [Draconibacterium sp.]|nr:DUF3267 domain-containing protein [Draconibacterium sp.]